MVVDDPVHRRSARPGEADKQPIAADRLKPLAVSKGVVDHEDDQRGLPAGRQRGQDIRDLVASHHDQDQVVAVVGFQILVTATGVTLRVPLSAC